MKTKTSLATLLAIGVAALLLDSQYAESKSSPPPHAASLNAHYAEIDCKIAAGGSSKVISLPILDRAVRISLSFTSHDGDFTFTEKVCFYRTPRSEFWVEGAGPILPDTFPDGLDLGGVVLVAGANGTFTIQSGFASDGLLHLGMWY